jgi:hypothetical protein
MSNVILKGQTDYEIYFSHQADKRNFNRGATKNIGFMAIREKYPEHYKQITFIFNDVDTMPFTNLFSYDTTPGVVKHYYGFKYALGGIVVIKGEDFERTNGYPCYWGWGNEDNGLQDRCIKNNIKIDRTDFYPIGNPNILQLFDGMSRLISKKDPWRYKNDTGKDGLTSITGLVYTIDDESSNFNDNIYSVTNPRIFYINTTQFNTLLAESADDYYKYDLREPSRQIVNPNKLEMVIGNKSSERVNKETIDQMNDWSYIPDPPNLSTNNRRENQDYIQYMKRMNEEAKNEQMGNTVHAGIKSRPANPMYFPPSPQQPYPQPRPHPHFQPQRQHPPPPQPPHRLYRPSPVSGSAGGKPKGMRFM